MIRWAVALCAALSVSMAWGHSDADSVKFNALDITNSKCCGNFRLVDDSGKVRTLQDFRGKVVILTFGYTNCPDVCPTTLSELAKVRRSLGAHAQDVQVLFVTLDPKRDTPKVLRRYLHEFDPTFIGLHGTNKQIAKTAYKFRIIFQKEKSKSRSTYTVYHMSGSYVFDTKGRPRLFVGVEKPEDLAKDIEVLINDRDKRFG